MIIREISIGKSVLVYAQPGVPEHWVKMSVTGELGENENPSEAVGKLLLFVDEQLGKVLPKINVPPLNPSGDIYFNVSKNKEERG